MRLFFASIAIALLSLGLAGGSTRAQEPIYPWCASYNTETGNHGTCGFYTYEQCMSYVSGLQGTCSRNPSYPSMHPDVVRSPRRHVR